MEESPVGAFRKKSAASVRRAANEVANGHAGAFFSAGNTGATFLAARAAFGMLVGVDRPPWLIDFQNRSLSVTWRMRLVR